MTIATPQLSADGIFESLREPLLILDARLHVKTASAAFYRTFNVTPLETTGRLLQEIGNGQWNNPALISALERILPENHEFDDFLVEFDFQNIGPRTMLLNGRQLRDEGSAPLILLAIQDITQRRKIERLLASSEMRYRRLFETAHDGILLVDADSGKIVDANRFLLDILGLPLSYFVGKELWEIGVFADIAENKAAMLQLLKAGTIRYEDLPLQNRDGRHIPVEFVSNVYEEHDRKVIQCNIRDISARKQFQREREAMLVNEQSLRIESEAANRSKDVFLATLSHEMRTPLNAILGWVSIMGHKNCSPEDIQEGIAVINRNVRAQAQLIDDVLDVSRIVSGKLLLEIAPAELSVLINEAIDAIRPAAALKGILFQVEIDTGASHVSCDPHRIRQVIWNLLTNSVKFTQKGGTITIKLSRNQSAARIEISDNGQGIEPALLPYIFDRFRQGEGGTKRQHGGLGLGLSLVKNLVELHGGRVSASSDGAGRGSLFTLHLPLRAVRLKADASVSDDEPPVAEVPPLRLDALRILVVDDEADARDLLAKVLRDAGAQVQVAGSVVEALQIIDSFEPEVLLSDIAMPLQDGYDLIRQVRKSGRRARDLPAVAITAFAHKDDIRQVLLAGFQMHIAKPVDPYDLITVVASIAGRTGT